MSAQSSMMKNILCLSLTTSITCLSSLTYAEKVQKLPAQSIQVSEAHLTTRIEWQQFPRIEYTDEDLMDSPRSAVVRVRANDTGKITSAEIQDSTGLKRLDQMIIDAVKRSKVKPHVENDMAIPIIGYQVFNLKLTEDGQNCKYSFNSKQWQVQQQTKKTSFKYLSQPELDITTEDLKGFDRKVVFKIKTNHKGQIKSVKISKGSGLFTLDQKLVRGLKGSTISSSRKASTLWIYKPASFKDEIQFQKDACF